MSYKNDHPLVILGKYGLANRDAKAQLYETYDQLRDLTVSGSGVSSSNFGTIGNFLVGLSRLVSPSSFMPSLSGSLISNVAGTSYSSSVTGGNDASLGGTTSFGFNDISSYTGLSGGAASVSNTMTSLLSGIGSNYGLEGVPTGGAAITPAVGSIGGVAAAASGNGSLILPLAGVVSGIGSLVSSVAPYFGAYGIGASLIGSSTSGIANAIFNSYNSVTGKILNNADTILSSKVKNIETVCKMLDAQSEVIKKTLKESMDADSKALQNI